LALNTRTRRRFAAAYGAPALRSLWRKPSVMQGPPQRWHWDKKGVKVTGHHLPVGSHGQYDRIPDIIEPLFPDTNHKPSHP
jgi:hypothetical protein